MTPPNRSNTELRKRRRSFGKLEKSCVKAGTNARKPGTRSAVRPPPPNPGQTEETAMATILIVDDEELVTRVVSVSLRRQGHQIVEAHSGAEARSVARQTGSIDLVIANYALRDAKGSEIV